MNWQPISTAPEGETVVTAIKVGSNFRQVQRLRRCGRLWFIPGGSMYVYYMPTHWLPAVDD